MTQPDHYFGTYQPTSEEYRHEVEAIVAAGGGPRREIEPSAPTQSDPVTKDEPKDEPMDTE